MEQWPEHIIKLTKEFDERFLPVLQAMYDWAEKNAEHVSIVWGVNIEDPNWSGESFARGNETQGCFARGDKAARIRAAYDILMDRIDILI